MVAGNLQHTAAVFPKRSIIYWQLIILMGLVIIRGLIYLALFPPWISPG